MINLTALLKSKLLQELKKYIACLGALDYLKINDSN